LNSWTNYSVIASGSETVAPVINAAERGQARFWLVKEKIGVKPQVKPKLRGLENDRDESSIGSFSCCEVNLPAKEEAKTLKRQYKKKMSN
jgi:hypothetical protein